MAHKKIYVAACGFLRSELAAAVKTAGLEGVIPVSGCADCRDCGMRWAAIEKQLPARGPAKVHLYGCKCLDGLGEPPQRLANAVVRRFENCAELVAGREMVAHALARKKCPLTPGWLSAMRENGHDSVSSKASYREKYSGLALFDTGVLPDAERLLKEFSEFTGLPAETVFVGLDVLRQTLVSAVREDELQTDLKEARQSLAERRVLLSHYSVTLEFIAGLTGQKSEREIINQLFMLFSRLFEPARISFIDLKNPDQIRHLPQAACDCGEIAGRMTGDADFYQIGETGFGLKISGNSGPLAAVEVDGVKYPERINYYLNISFLVAQICGLGIENTRRYEVIRAAQDRLEIQYRHFISLLNNIDSAVVVFDIATGKLVFANRFAEGVFGPAGDRDYRAFLGSHDIILPSSSAADAPFNFFSTSGNRWHIAVSRWISWWDGRDVILLTATDITELKETTERADKAKRAADEANRAKSDFLSGMSHEIRNPLNIVCNMAVLLGETELAPEQKTFIQVLKNASDNLLLIANDILDLSKIEAGRMTLDETVFDVRELVESVCGMMSVKAGRKHIELRLTIGPDVPDTIVADATRLRQILFNLLDNAIKFTEQGHVALAVTRSAAAGKPDLLNFTVTDTGTGIPLEKQSLLFGKFSQLHGNCGKLYGGTGLGLNLSQQFARLMRGSIYAHSRENEGSRFWLEIPLFAAPASPAAETPAPENEHSGRKLKILIVEDSRDNIMIIRAFLKKQSHTLTECYNGKEAVEAFRRERFDLILMDIQMPVMDGYTATRLIREHEQEGNLPRTPIVVLSAYSTSEEQQRALELGCDRYLTKPLTRTGVLETIAHYARRNSV
ncbi:MAG: ATP-binding protein [Elusimicrobiaceae bacterium]|nr:ATP-binding protein [Elusimicrobiaceae bacterium]